MTLSDEEILKVPVKTQEHQRDYKLPIADHKIYKMVDKKNNYQEIKKTEFNPNSWVKKGCVLQYAILSKSPDNVKAVLEKGANPNVTGDDLSMLMLAMKRKEPEMVSLLIKYGADPFFKNTEWKGAMDFGNEETRRAFIGYKGNSKPKDDLITCAKNNDTDGVLYWIAKGKDCDKEDKKGRIPAHYACMNGNLFIFWTLYKIGANWSRPVDKKLHNPLYYAIKNNHLNIVKFWCRIDDIKTCLDHGNSPLMVAVLENRVEITEYLSKICDPKYAKKWDPETAIFMGARTDHVDCVAKLLQIHPSLINDIVSNHSLMMYAAKYNSIKTIKFLQSKNVDPKSSVNGLFPLSIAAKSGSFDAVREFIHAGVEADINEKNGETPLMLATQEGNYKVVEYLIEKGANFIFNNSNNESPFLYSVKYKKQMILEIFLNKANDYQAIEVRRNCLYYAIETVNFDATELILKYVNKNNENKYDCLVSHAKSEDMAMFLLKTNKKEIKSKGKDIFGAIEKSSLPGVKYYLVKDPSSIENKTPDNFTPIMIASKFGNAEIVDYLISIGANRFAVTADGTDALAIAVQNNYVDVVKSLFNSGVDIKNPRTNGDVPVAIACKYGSIDVLKFFKKQEIDFANVPSSSEIPVALAVINGDIDTVRYLCNELNIDVNTMSRNKTPLLILAIENNQYNIFTYLLSKKANIFLRDANGNSALHSAVAANNLDIVINCIEQHIDVNDARPADQITPYLIACYKGNEQIMQFLESKGANSNIRTEHNVDAFLASVESGNINIINNLISKGFNYETKDSNGMTPLLVACKFGHFKIVKLLDSKGANFKNTDTQSHNALYYACQSGDIDTAKFVFKKKLYDINQKFENNMTLLHIAAMKGHLKIVKFLEDKKADLYAKSDGGLTPFHYAAMNNHVDVMEFFWKEMQKRKDPVFIKTADEVYPIELAIKNNAIKAANFCLSKNCQLNTKDKSGLSHIFRASRDGDMRSLRILLNNCAPSMINEIENGQTPSAIAIKNEHWDVVKLLKSYKANISNDKILSGIHIAVQENNIEKFDTLRELGFSPNERGQKGKVPLMAAIEQGSTALISHMLDINVDISAADDNGFTPLMYAVNKGDSTTLQKLIQRGAKINIRCGWMTPLISAIQNDKVDCFNILIQNGAKLDFPHKGGWYPIHESAKANNGYYLKTLIEKKVNINTIEKNTNMTPLMVSIIRGDMDNFKLLLDNGADIKPQAKGGFDALYQALINKRFEMCDILREKGARFDVKNANGMYADEYCVVHDLPEPLFYVLKFASPFHKIKGDPILTACIRNGAYNTAFLMIDNGYDVTELSKNMQRPLHACAMRSNDKDSVLLAKKLLAANDKVINEQDQNKDTPLSLTKWYSNSDRRLAKYLKQNGARDIVFESTIESKKKDLDKRKMEFEIRRAKLEATHKIIMEDVEEHDKQVRIHNARVNAYNREGDRLDNKSNSFFFMAFATEGMQERHANAIDAHNSYGGARISAQNELLDAEEKKLLGRAESFKKERDEFNSEYSKFSDEFDRFYNQLEIYRSL